MTDFRATLLVLWSLGPAGLGAVACGGKADPPPPEPDPVVVFTAPAPAPAAPETPEAPESEEALVHAFTAALSARDLEATAALAAPELAADLRRMHGTDAEAFWGRGQRWVDNVKSGFTVGAKQDGREDRWRLLLRFDNGEEETVVVTRVNGRLVFFSL